MMDNQDDFVSTNDLTEKARQSFFDAKYVTVPALPERCVSVAPYTNAGGLVQCVKTGGHRSKTHRNGPTTWTDPHVFAKKPKGAVIHVTRDNVEWAATASGITVKEILELLRSAEVRGEVCAITAR